MRNGHRGDFGAKVTNVSGTSTNTNDESKLESKNGDNNTKTKTSSSDTISLRSGKTEKYGTRAVTKEKAKTLVAQMSNFCKLWANVEGYSVGDGSENGGFFLRNVAKVFKDKKFVKSHDWNDIIFKIREYTKRDVTLVGVFNFTQLVENEGTMEKPIRFDINVPNVIYKTNTQYLNDIADNKDEILAAGDNDAYDTDTYTDAFDDGIDELNKITITNLSTSSVIAVFVENEPINEDRSKLLNELTAHDEKKSDGDQWQLFTSKGYQIIDAANSASRNESQKRGSEGIKCVKTLDSVYVTVIDVTKGELIYDRRQFVENYLYFHDDTLKSLINLKPKCNNLNGGKHNLVELNLDINSISRANNNDNYNYKFKCNACKIEDSEVYYHCYKCKYSLCQGCCHLKICSRKR